MQTFLYRTLTLGVCCFSVLCSAAQALVVAPARPVSDVTLTGKLDTQLLSKMERALTGSGVATGDSYHTRFALVPTVSINDERTIPSLPPRSEIEADLVFSIVNHESQKSFATYTVPMKCAGSNKTNALAHGFKTVQLNTASFLNFVKQAEREIYVYYTKELPVIVRRAQTAANTEKYDEALYILAEVPDNVPGYTKVLKTMEGIYQKKVDLEGARLLTQAKAAWSASPDASGASQAAEFLGGIQPHSKSAAGAKLLLKQIEKRMVALNNREWAAQQQQLTRAYALQRSAINAARDVAVAYAKSRPRVSYHYHFF